MAQKTPNLHAKGTYTVAVPFTITSGAVYECIAIRSFIDLQKEGINVKDKYYVPATLGDTEYNADAALGANIITLASPNHPTLYIPDTYITAIPFLNTVAYSSVVLSLSLGAIPDELDLTFLMDQIAAACSDVIGLEPTVNKHIAPHTGVITSDQHDVLETARLAAVTNRTTDRAKVLQLQTANEALAEEIAGLQAYIVEHLPPTP